MTDIQGCGTALVTPFTKDNRVDVDALKRLVRWQIESGIDFLVPCGTTGESVTLDEDEYRQVIRTCVQEAGRKVPIVAGAGSNNTEHVKHLARMAEAEGADAVLSVTPYYNKPSQEGLVRHFTEIAGAITIPIVLYNVPGRTGCNMLPATIARLAQQVPNVVAVKEASGNIAQIMELFQVRPAGFAVLSGDDALAFAIVALGGQGLISVVSNIIPRETSGMIRALRRGDLEEARRLQYRYLNLMNLNFIESNPIPVKYAVSRLGYIEEVYRLPLCPMADANKRKMDQELEKLELIASRV
ncbi:MAG: 4-hydroxy-tetrahydrodipicolinate synthase [Acidobacteria bacterium]|nr:MAG: 4-hydroxy-tetrahydrodipicolinate synthase [Acidobacteriota bacterium]